MRTTTFFAGVVALVPFILPGVSSAENRVMFFGDSNTWGQVPFEGNDPGSRFDAGTRWTGIAGIALGEDYTVIEEGLPGRTAGSDDPSLPMISGAGMNGAEYLSAAVATSTPLDMVVIMLGTNDVKTSFELSVLDISHDILGLAIEASQNTGVGSSYEPADVLVVAPPPLGEIADIHEFPSMFNEDAVEQSLELANVLGPLVESAGFNFFDAGSVIPSMDGADGVHLTPASHEELGKAIAAEIVRIKGE
ncbi:MAG: GDSL-type esterase/lipase family protein [Pseudomonadota bacterium]